eukprot:CAMPEP_0113562148 /NCGR_PEP_ID=MMETSP0015_2-20120614/20369_1 /TAXON_ID=2838 /ORGANISM="Odontella" /LENGTH=119 /DNA_ID=CAMNT_0000464019 /DNA_START=104 /DNA_END=463 /DNA_ORIENTATION=- /assembly_acc=CAM_ASM_000160
MGKKAKSSAKLQKAAERKIDKSQLPPPPPPPEEEVRLLALRNGIPVVLGPVDFDSEHLHKSQLENSLAKSRIKSLDMFVAELFPLFSLPVVAVLALCGCVFSAYLACQFDLALRGGGLE